MLYLLILISVFLYAISGLVSNNTIKSGGNFISVAVLLNLPIGFFCLIYCLFYVDLSSISILNWGLLLASGILWSISCYLRLDSFKDINTSTSYILGTLQLIILTLAGVIIFSEAITLPKIIGILITIIAICLMLDFKDIQLNSGACKRLLSTIFAAVAVIIAKQLSTLIPFEIILALDYFIPGAIIAIVFPSCLTEFKSAIKHSRYLLLFTPPLVVLAYFLKLKVFSMGGELMIVSIICQTGLAFVLFIEVFLLKQLDNLYRRSLSAALCSTGAILVASF